MVQILSPGVSVDKVRAHLPKKHTEAIFGHYEGPEWPIVLPYQWLNVGTGMIAVRSHVLAGHPRRWKHVTLEFNPSQIENGHNLFQYADPVQFALEDALHLVRRYINQLKSHGYDLEWRDSIVRHAGHFDLSVLHLCADWVFPNNRELDRCFNHLVRFWTWARNRRRNPRYPTTLYLNQNNWDFVIYSKEEQIEASHQLFPGSTRALAKNRLRVEVRLKRSELRTLGRRMAAATKHRIHWNYGLGHFWDELLYQQVFDLYAGRLKRCGNQSRPLEGVPPLYRLFASYGATPVWHRVLKAVASAS